MQLVHFHSINSMNRLLLIFLTFLSVVQSYGQLKKVYRQIQTASSDDGNYLFLLEKNDLNQPFFLSTIDHFTIKRTVISAGLDSVSLAGYAQKLKPIAELKRKLSIEQLKLVMNNKYFDGYKAALKLKSDTQLVAYFNTHIQPEDYLLLYPLIETKLALGHVFLDKDVQKGTLYYYEIYSVNKSKKESFFAKAIALGKAGNYHLPYFKALKNGLSVRDSTLSMSWAVPINFDLDKLPKPEKRFQFDPEGNLYNSPFSFANLKAKISLKKNDVWEQLPMLIIPQVNTTKDTLFVSYFKNALPNEVVEATIILDDGLHNQGGKADTIIAYMLTDNTAPKLTSMSVKDTLNGLRISWAPFTQSKFLSGIQIIRYTNVHQGDTLPLVPLTDTQYFDYNIKAGVQYRYEARVLYQPGIYAFQVVPASSFGTLTKFSKPLPPYHVTAEVEGKNIRVNWDVAKDPTIANYFLYRGTSPNNLLLIPGMISGNTYLDTVEALSGGSTYYYAAVSQNLKQDTSIYSNLATVIPNRKIHINAPTAISYYYANGKLNIFWEDARSRDNKVVKYLVQKKKVGIDTGFAFLVNKPIGTVNIGDSQIVAGITYQYRVASVSFKGDTSNFSEVAQFALPKKEGDKIDRFAVANLPNGIHIKLPNLYMETRKAYCIYRRSANDLQFKKIITIRANQYEYTDESVAANEIYQYALSVVESDDREGGLGNIMTIRH